MIVDERIITFINSMDTENSEILETIEQEALAADVPIIRREMQSFLEVLLLMKKPMRVLEVGTAVGFSALLMSNLIFLSRSAKILPRNRDSLLIILYCCYMSAFRQIITHQ